jgi:hypothetical protein
VCGSCLIVLHALRTDLMYQASMSGEAWPSSAADSLADLSGTRWAGFLDMGKALVSYRDVDLMSVPTIGFAPESVAHTVAETSQRLFRPDST